MRSGRSRACRRRAAPPRRRGPPLRGAGHGFGFAGAGALLGEEQHGAEFAEEVEAGGGAVAGRGAGLAEAGLGPALDGEEGALDEALAGALAVGRGPVHQRRLVHGEEEVRQLQLAVIAGREHLAAEGPGDRLDEGPHGVFAVLARHVAAGADAAAGVWLFGGFGVGCVEFGKVRVGFHGVVGWRRGLRWWGGGVVVETGVPVFGHGIDGFVELSELSNLGFGPSWESRFSFHKAEDVVVVEKQLLHPRVKHLVPWYVESIAKSCGGDCRRRKCVRAS